MRRVIVSVLILALWAAGLASTPAAAQQARVCDGQVATIVGTSGNDTLVGTSGPDVIAALQGNDVIRGLGGDDIICGGQGNDQIFGGAGFDIIFGAQGNDVIYAANGSSLANRQDVRGARMFGGDGDDTIYGSNRWDRMQGGQGNDSLHGYEGRDWMRAGPNTDRVDGGPGIDDLHGGNGRDTILLTNDDSARGGAGLDLCTIASGTPANLISCGLGDRETAAAPVGCASTVGNGHWRTQNICGVWEIINPAGQVTTWNAVNVRGHSLVAHPLDNNDVRALKTRFDYVRLNLHWIQIQPQRGRLQNSNDHVAQAKQFLDHAHANGIGVILDPAHLGGDNAAIPGWAWDQAGIRAADRDMPHSYMAWAGADDKATNLKHYFDELHAAGILNHPAVIAIEVVNEPHPKVGSGNAVSERAQRELAVAYRESIQHIRSFNDMSDALVIVGAFFGGTRHGGAPVSATNFSHNGAKAEITDKGIDNVVWTAHNYFTGLGDTAGINDGQGPEGQRGFGNWAEGYTTSGCYAATRSSGGGAWSCGSQNQRGEAQRGILNNATEHWRWAQQADMPFFMGEWGVPRQRFQDGQYRGWIGADELFCDKLSAYDDVDGQGHAISWAYWSFDAAADAFGIYNSANLVRTGDTSRSFLSPNSWLDSGTFDNQSSGWSGQRWELASPFASQTACS